VAAGDIRPFERSDAAEVARLYDLVVRSGRPASPERLASYFQRTLIDYPWADPEIPSLVQTDRDVAFQGSHVRRASLDGRVVRLACAGQLVSHPDARSRGAGAMLLRAYLAGPQELTFTDGATDRMRDIWTRLGGRMAPLPCISWTKVLRPLGFSASRILGPTRRGPGAAAPALRALDAVATRLRAFRPPPAQPALSSEPLTPGLVLEHLPAVARQVRLCPAYDEDYLRWMFEELAAVTARGRLIATLVRERAGGRALGWYVYYLLPGGLSNVLQLASTPRDTQAVLDRLLHDAWTGGALAVRGRVEAPLLESLGRRGCLMHFTGEALIHGGDGELSDAILSGSSLLSRVDGEWWMGHHVLDFEGPA